MPLRRIAAVSTLALLAAVALAFGAWWLLIREDAAPATTSREIDDEIAESLQTATPEATGSPTTGPTSPAQAGVEAFTIVTEQSTASYFADEKLASLPTGSTAEGRTTIEGVFYLTPEGLDAAQATVFTVDLAGLESSESRRDTRVRSALQTSQFPVATFTASSLQGFPGEFPADGTEITMQLTGILDLRGVQREVTWEVQARRDGDIISAIATINFLYADFNIPVPNIAGFVSVEDDVTLQANIIATKS